MTIVAREAALRCNSEWDKCETAREKLNAILLHIFYNWLLTAAFAEEIWER